VLNKWSTEVAEILKDEMSGYRNSLIRNCGWQVVAAGANTAAKNLIGISEQHANSSVT
jgi:hypothetical protein